jgi:glycosyltransferase involved in cell wall biosynthesis
MTINKPMRILYGITKSNWGGAQRYVYDLAIAAQEAGHDVAVLCGGEGPLVQKLNQSGVRVIPLPLFDRDIAWKKDFLSLMFIIRTIRRERPDVLHINSAKMGGAGMFTGRLLRLKKIVFTAHGWAFNEARPWWQKILIEELSWLIVVGSHRTICVSEKVKRDMNSRPFMAEKLKVIHNGAEPFDQLSAKDAREKLGLEVGKKEILIGTLSELHKNKGLDVMLRALAQASDHIRFAILGAGEEMHELRELSARLGIKDKVHLLGFVDNGREYLKAFDIFTLTSRTEGLPYALIEAGLTPLPVIATNVGGIPEVIVNGLTGLLVDSERTTSLAQALTKLSEDGELRKTLAKNLLKHVTENFSKSKMVEETLKLYR